MPYRPILATLGYVFSPDRRQVLLVHRTARPDDAHSGKYNGLGGKLEPGEDAAAGLRRELREEAGIDCTAFHLAGTISWPGFGADGDDWFGFLFRITAWDGTVRAASPEGPLVWVNIDQVLQLPLWDGDRYFLPRVFDLTAPVFHGVLPYREGRPLGWTVTEETRSYC